MLRQLIDGIFGCSHRRTTFPLTPARAKGVVLVRNIQGMGRSTYVVCLDCGKEFSYNWDEMRIGVSLPSAVRTTQPMTQEAIE